MAMGNLTSSKDRMVDSLRPLQRRVRWFDFGRYGLFFLAFGLIFLLLILWFDTVWALPSSVRWSVSRIGPGIALAAGVGFIIWRWSRVTPEKVVGRVDRAIESGGEILAGWQLATRPILPASELSRGMAALASDQAIARLKQVIPQQIVDANVLRRAAAYFASAAMLVSAISALAPELTRYQIHRFLFPSRDLPPFTGTIIQLDLASDEVLYGQDALVEAEVVRGRAETMHLVVTTKNGQEQVLPMLADNDHHWKGMLTRVTEPLELYARSGSSRSQKRQLSVQMTPQLLPPIITVTPPAYTRGSIYRGPIPEQGIQGLKGTKVEWEVNSNRPLAQGQLILRFRDGRSEVLSLEPSTDSKSVVRGSLTLSQPAQFELTIEDVEGIPSQENVTGTLQILDDRRPIVRISRPQKLSLATPDIVLPVVVNAEDDFGITKLALYRSLNGSPAIPIEGTVSAQSRVEHTWQLQLPEYQLQSGDEIQLFARTEDNDPEGPKGAESPITTIRIISVSEFQEMMLQRKGAESIQAKYQAARRHFDQLASELRKVQEASDALAQEPGSVEAQEQLQKTLDAAQQAAQKAAEEIAKLSKQPMPIDIDQELTKRLSEMANQASEMSQQLQQMEKDPASPLSAEQSQQLQEMLEQSQNAQKRLTDEAINPLGQMQRALPLMIAQQQFAQLVAQQRDLADRLGSLDNTDPEDPATQRRLAELEAEQQQIKQQLDQLLEHVEQQAAQLAEDDPEFATLKKTANEFVEQVRASRANTEMSATQQSLIDAKTDEAEQSAKIAAEILESFLSKNSEMGQQGENACKAAFKPNAGGAKLGNSLQQMLAMMGMKPGQSGAQPGMGAGMGAGGGFAKRFPGPQNIGLYGSLPTPQSSSQQGLGEPTSAGISTNQPGESPRTDVTNAEPVTVGSAAGQAVDSVPVGYRNRVAEYFRNLSENLGEAEVSKVGNEP